eukprot:scaffold344_cov132-Skeletonema_menzelii.AAC.6
MRDIITEIDEVLVTECCPYPDMATNIDAAWIAARAFSTLALIGGFLWILTDTIISCAHGRVEPGPIWMGHVLLLTCFCSGLTLIALSSSMCKNNEMLSTDQIDGYEFNDQCEIAYGGILVITATVFWFVASLCSLAANRSKNKYDESARSDTMEPLIWEGP